MRMELTQGYVLKPQDPASGRCQQETEELFQFIDDNIIGKGHTFVGPFGRRKVVFCDYLASSKYMEFVEDFIKKEVLPWHSNIDASANVTTTQSLLFREEARDIVSCAVNTSEEDILLFVGNGCSAAVRKLIKILHLPMPPIVFFGASEHQSNLLPWIEIGSKIIRISETKEGMIDLTDLEAKLMFFQKNSVNQTMIGCFSAASATSGIVADDIATTILLHEYGALAFWDYDIAAPYVSLDMNPLVPGINQKGAYKDVMFFSGHKFVGGVQSSGILVAKKTLLQPVPLICNVFSSYNLVKEDLDLKDEQTYEDNEAGIVESVRAGIAMKIKQTIGVSAIMEREAKIVKTVCSFFRKIPEIVLLGSTTLVDRLAVFSIMVRHPRGTFLHHNFICAVLNDMFGIQAKGGCTCAQSYAQDLMGIGKKLASTYKSILNNESDAGEKQRNTSYEILRPGFTRISLPYFMSESEMAYVLESIKMVATEGWKLLPQYILNPETGEWKHNSNTTSRERKRLGSIMYVDGKMLFPERKLSTLSSCPADFSECLRIARSTFNKSRKIARRYPVPDQCSHLDKMFINIRWFMLPIEAQDLLRGNFQKVKQQVPFSPNIFMGSRPDPSRISDDDNNVWPVKEKAEIVFRDPRLLRQRSESNSPARDEKDTPKHKQLLRERCYSLCSTLVPENHSKFISLPRQRLFSGGSQADNTDSETSLLGDDFRAMTPPPSLRNTPDLVYVEGVTKELASEIKSELREVIAQVDDVLSENNEFDYNCHLPDKRGSFEHFMFHKRKAFSLPNTINSEDVTSTSFVMQQNNLAQKRNTMGKSCMHNSLPTTISAERFSEYLVGFTSDVVSEMKSEFRDVVNVVDGLISPTLIHDEDKSSNTKICLDGFEDENNISVTKTFPGSEATTFPQSLLSSQDSGINLGDRDSPPELNEKCSASINQVNDDKNCTLSEIQLCGVPKKVSSAVLWHLPPKNIWNPTCEAIRVFDMIKEGDRVMINLNNKRESFSLLHTLHQYQYYASSKGKKFTLGVFIESSRRKSIVSYLETLGVELFYDDKTMLDKSLKAEPFANCIRNKHLCAVAKHYNYNVIAFGNHLDDLAEYFLMSVFHRGCLQTMKANFYLLENAVRVIRPFAFVREKNLNKFSDNINLPKLDLSSFETSQEHIRIKQLLAKEEILHPKLFYSLKTAIIPLMTDWNKTLKSNKIY